MSGVAVAALVLVCVWLGVLSLVVVLLVRQIGLLTVRLSVASQALSLDNDGPEVGSKLPDEVVSALPALEGERAYVVLLSATCDPCRELVSDIGERHFEQTIVALVPGREQMAGELASLLPSGMQAVLDPEASRLAEALKIHSTPFALETADGTVTRKAYLHGGAADLVEFVAPENTAARAESLVQVMKRNDRPGGLADGARRR
jgi:hypothetical protein